MSGHFWYYHLTTSSVRDQRSVELAANHKVLVVTTGMISESKRHLQILEGFINFGVPLMPNQCLTQSSCPGEKKNPEKKDMVSAPSQSVCLGRRFK